jgi:hypothetical protein
VWLAHKKAQYTIETSTVMPQQIEPTCVLEPIEVEQIKTETKEPKPGVPTTRKNIESEEVLQARADEALASRANLKEFCDKYGLKISHVLCGTFIHSTLLDPHSDASQEMAARLRGYFSATLAKRIRELASILTPSKDRFGNSLRLDKQDSQKVKTESWIINDTFSEVAEWLLEKCGPEYLRFFSAYCKFSLGKVAHSRFEDRYLETDQERSGLTPYKPKDKSRPPRMAIIVVAHKPSTLAHGGSHLRS